MIKFHYMWRGHSLSAMELRQLSSELEEVGYRSVLLPFSSERPDYLIKSAAALIPGNKLKYMIALRPYHMSPQYCAMATEGFNQIEQGRLIFNWVPGYLSSQMDVYGNTDTMDTIVKRTTFLRKFVEQYKTMPTVTVQPDMVFSGDSEYTLETAKLFNGTTLSDICDYRKNKNIFDEVGIEKRMVSVNLIILNSQEKVEEYKNFLITKNPRFLEMSIIGTIESIKKDLIELKNEKITDVLVTTILWEFLGKPQELSKKNDILVNDLIKEIIRGESHV